MAGRRLTAILAADIAGYSALMGANEVDTVSSLKGHQSVILPMIAGFDGRVIDIAGDGILAEFPSVLNATKCAASIQEVMLERNASVAPDRRMQFRIGINQGDVLFDDKRIFGEGIDVAARLEGICDPGDICISAKVYEEIKGRFEGKYKDIGEQNLKNIAVPVRAYKISIAGTAQRKPQPVAPSSLRLPSLRLPSLRVPSLRIPRMGWIATAIAAILLFGSGAVWWSLTPYQSTEQGGNTSLSTENSAAPKSTAKAEASNPVPPVATPSVAAAPAETPSVAAAPAETPPVETPSVAAAPAETPSVAAAPAETPTVGTRAESDPERDRIVLADAKNPPAQATPKPPTIDIPPAAAAALKDLDKKLLNDPKDVVALSQRGQLYARNNEYSLAKLDFDGVLRLQPKDVEALNNRCWASAILGELASALKDCDEVLKLRPNYVDALDSRGFVKLKMGMTRDAIADYDAALKLDGQKASSLYGRGIARQRAGNAAGANADIARAKAIDPGVAYEFVGYGIR